MSKQTPCTHHKLSGCLACKNRSYNEQLPPCQCVVAPHSLNACTTRARYSVVRDGQRIYVCSGCMFSEDKNPVDLFTREDDMAITEEEAEQLRNLEDIW